LSGCSVEGAELTAADQGMDGGRKAGKGTECPAEFAAAEKVNAEAHSLCNLCTRDQAIAKANQAITMVNALCPAKAVARPAPAPAPAPPPPAAAPAPTVAISTDSPSVKEGQCANLMWS